MKIAILQDDFPPHHKGGAGVIAHQLAKAFAHAGHEILVITAVQNIDEAGSFDSEGMRIVRLYSNYHTRFRAYVSLYNPRVTGEVRRLLRAFAPDVVHVHSVHTHLSYYSLILARKYARKVFMTEHDAMSFYYGKLPSETDKKRSISSGASMCRESLWKQFKMYRWRYNPFRTMIIRRILRKNVDRSIVVSDALMYALNYNGITNTEVIHNGIDVIEWERPRNIEDFKMRHGVENNAILFGGRLSGPKGAMKILEALAQIREKVSDVQLLIIGKKDAYADRIIEHARTLGVEDLLVWTGWISGDDLRAAYYVASVVVVPSVYLDPFPTVNLEALACHKPVVATCFGGSSEVIQDGVNGYIVNPLDVGMLTTKITDLLIDKPKNQKFGEAGYACVSKEFSLERQTVQYEQLFSKKITN